MRDYLTKLIAQGVHRVEYLKDIPLPKTLIEKPKIAEHGDYASNIALAIAKLVGRPPQSIAQDIVASLQPDPQWIDRVDVVSPGFINFRLTNEWLWDGLRRIHEEGTAYGRIDLGKGKSVQIEFVSANPTGPLNVVSARAAAVGDALANILTSVGYTVEREYYVNDAGRQMDLLTESVDAAYHRLLGIEVPTPDDGYHGEYIEGLARIILKGDGKYVKMDASERKTIFRTLILEEILKSQRECLEQFRLVYDVWFSERELRETGALDNVLSKLSKDGYVYERDGAIWFTSTNFGDEKDRVLVMSNEQPTYFLSDIAYHQNKYERGFEWIIDLWGPDHHGHIARMKAAMEALGYEPETLELKIVQQVNLLQAGEKSKMSKREGRLVSMNELINEVGVDVARFFFLMRKTNAHLDFDLDLAREHSDENPVYYIQYAHARICSILRHADESGHPRPELEDTDVSLLDAEEELNLIRKLLTYPEVVERCTHSLEPQGLTAYLHEVASDFHPFYHHHRVLTENHELTAARLVLVEAVKLVLKSGLSLFNISAPEKM